MSISAKDFKSSKIWLDNCPTRGAPNEAVMTTSCSCFFICTQFARIQYLFEISSTLSLNYIRTFWYLDNFFFVSNAQKDPERTITMWNLPNTVITTLVNSNKMRSFPLSYWGHTSGIYCLIRRSHSSVSSKINRKESPFGKTLSNTFLNSASFPALMASCTSRYSPIKARAQNAEKCWKSGVSSRKIK